MKHNERLGTKLKPKILQRLKVNNFKLYGRKYTLCHLFFSLTKKLSSKFYKLSISNVSFVTYKMINLFNIFFNISNPKYYLSNFNFRILFFSNNKI